MIVRQHRYGEPRTSTLHVKHEPRTASIELNIHRGNFRDEAMSMTREAVARKLAAYFHHELSLHDLVDWAQLAMREGEFEDLHYNAIRDAVTRLGLADVRAFELTWEDRTTILNWLGYNVRVEIVTV
jgi:hypothetical protein